MKKICVIGNFSGRNAGDNAILEGLLNDIYSIYQNVKFFIPTINKSFIETNYKRFPVKAVPMMPWNLSLKILGLPIFRTVLKSDLVLITDAILFDRKLWNPLFNYLSTMAIVLPMAKSRGVPVVIYNASIGPVTTNIGEWCLNRVIESAELILVRDKESVALLTSMDIRHNNIRVCADCALNTLLPTPKRIEEIKKNESILNEKDRYMSFNINAYIDLFVRGNKMGIGTSRFVSVIAETMDKIVEVMDKKIVFVITQVMDIKIAEMVLSRMKQRQGVTLVTNKTYTHNELAGILSQVEMHVGMRTHSIILATSSCTPSIGIVYRPKNRGYLNTIEQRDMIVEMDDRFTTSNLFNLIQKVWTQRKTIRENLKPIMDREKNKAKESAKYLRPYLPD